MKQRLQQLAAGGPAQALAIMALRAVTLATKFALTLFIAKYMGLASLGWYGLLAGATIIGPALLGFGLSNTLARDAVGQPLSGLTLNLRNLWVLVSGLYGLAALGAVAVGLWLGQPWLLLAALAVVWLEHLNNDIFNMVVNQQRALLANGLNFIRSGLWALVFMLVAWCWPQLATLPVLVGFWLVGLVPPVLLFAWYSRRWPWLAAWRQPFKRAWFTQHISKARMVYTSDLALVGGQYLDRFMVSAFLGMELTGVYVLFWQVGNAVHNLVFMGVMQQFRPRLIAAFKAADAVLFKRLYRQCIGACSFSVVGLAVVAGMVVVVAVPYLNRPLAVSYLPLLPLLLAGVVIRHIADAVGQGFSTRYMDSAHAQVLLGGVALSVLVNTLLLGNGAGIYGAGIAVLLVGCLLLAWRIWWLRSLFK